MIIVLPATALLAVLRMRLIWRLPADTHMGAFVVVEAYNTFEDALAFLPGGDFHLVEPFTLEDAVCALCNGVLQRISALGHTDADTMALQFCHISILSNTDSRGRNDV